MANKTRFSNVNGKATVLSKPFTGGTYAFIVRNAGKMTAKNMAEVLHRPVSTIRSVARRLKVSLSINS